MWCSWFAPPLPLYKSFDHLVGGCCNLVVTWFWAFIQALHLFLTILWTGINPPIPTSLSCVIPLIIMGLNFVTICLMLTCKLWCNYFSPSCIVVADHGFINLTFAFFSLDLYSIQLVIVPLLTIFLLCVFFFLYAFWFPNFICSFLFNCFPLESV
jgi:hypothetical protein